MQTYTLTPAAKSHIDAQLTFFNDASDKILRAIQKVNELNIQAVQNIVLESINCAYQLWWAKNPNEFLSLISAQIQPAAEKGRGYQQNLRNIAARAQADLYSVAETHMPEASRTAAALAEEVLRIASEEAEKAVERQREATKKMESDATAAANAAREEANGSAERIVGHQYEQAGNSSQSPSVH
jgi:phasin family protein